MRLLHYVREILLLGLLCLSTTVTLSCNSIGPKATKGPSREVEKPVSMLLERINKFNGTKLQSVDPAYPWIMDSSSNIEIQKRIKKKIYVVDTDPNL